VSAVLLAMFVLHRQVMPALLLDVIIVHASLTANR